MITFKAAVELIGQCVDGLGVLVIAGGVVYAALRQALRKERAGVYREFRHSLGQAILLGLELLVAGDIIRTVAVRPTMESVLVLGLIVVIRTVLSFSIQVELEGRWPWERGRAGEKRGAEGAA